MAKRKQNNLSGRKSSKKKNTPCVCIFIVKARQTISSLL